MSSGWGIGGIQLTEILLSWLFASYIRRSRIYVVVFCREAMKGGLDHFFLLAC